MSNSNEWILFPYPTLRQETRTDGSLVAWPGTCLRCSDRQCERTTASPKDIRTCSFGMNFLRVNEDLLIAGLVVTDLSTSSTAARKKKRLEAQATVKKAELFAAAGAAAKLNSQEMSEISKRNKKKLEDMINSSNVLEPLLDELRAELKNSLNRSHDFLALLKQIRGHIVTILEERYPGVPTAEAAAKTQSEGSIFFTTELMLAKIDATLFLDESNRVFGDEATFILHKLVLKYVRIYSNGIARPKGVDLRLNGESHGHVRYNYAAISAVVHSLLDNLVKYAPAGSKADVLLDERDTEILMSFKSFGPQILVPEREKIFLPGYRAEAARQLETSGQGFGLAAARRIADLLSLRLRVSQDEEPSHEFPGHYVTTFSVRLAKLQTR